MEINDVTNPERRSAVIAVRTLPSYSSWMKEKGISPSLLFNKAIEELMKKEKEEETEVIDDNNGIETEDKA